MMSSRRPAWVAVTAVVAAAAIASVAVAVTNAGASPPDELQAVKAATARYHSFEQAEQAGYTVEGEPCIASPLGTMGVHAVNPALIADPAIDPLRPEVLLYLPDADGKLRLVGVEYLKADADGSLATDDDRPSVLGQAFDGPMPGHNPTMPVHYDLHVWLWEANPAGLFAMFNPSIACP